MPVVILREGISRRTSIRVSYNRSGENEDDTKELDVSEQEVSDYSINEVSESFTVVRGAPNLASVIEGQNEDTDIEADDEFKEYSEVRLEEPEKTRKTRARKSTIVAGKLLQGTEVPQNKKASTCLACPTNCAHTYSHTRDKRRRAVSTVVSPLSSNLNNNNSISNMRQNLLNKNINKHIQDTSEDTESLEESEKDDKVPKLRVRKKSKFLMKGVVEEKRPIEGSYKLVGSINYEDYLGKVGTGPCSMDMVMRADMVLSIEQEEDKQWKISNETLIKAKSVRGYRTNNRKWTENKFVAGEAKPELLDDWDQRLIVTTLEVNPEGTRLTLNQVAEKDQWHHEDSTVVLEIETEEGDVYLIMTSMAADVVSWRKFKKIIKQINRKISSPF